MNKLITNISLAVLAVVANTCSIAAHELTFGSYAENNEIVLDFGAGEERTRACIDAIHTVTHAINSKNAESGALYSTPERTAGGAPVNRNTGIFLASGFGDNPVRGKDDTVLIIIGGHNTSQSISANILNSTQLQTYWANSIKNSCPQVFQIEFALANSDWYSPFRLNASNKMVPLTRFIDYPDAPDSYWEY